MKEQNKLADTEKGMVLTETEFVNKYEDLFNEVGFAEQIQSEPNQDVLYQISGCALSCFLRTMHKMEYMSMQGSEEPKDFKTTFKFYRNDDAPYVGAYRVGSLTNGEPTIMFNLDFEFQLLNNEPKEKRLQFFKDGLLQTLTHEFCHALQEWLGKEFDELEVEKILGAYNEKWNVFEAENADEQPEDVFKISELLRWLDSTNAATVEEFKAELNDVFMAHRLWIEAEGKSKEEQNAQASVATKMSDEQNPDNQKGKQRSEWISGSTQQEFIMNDERKEVLKQLNEILRNRCVKTITVEFNHPSPAAPNSDKNVQA